jgi:hypothetical protein
MGLDMYLAKKTYVKNWDHQEKHHKITVEYDGKIRTDIKPERISYIVEDIMYWRKENAIHAWFVENCQEGEDDCRESYVTAEDLTKLADLCDLVLESKDGELLPTQGGFFFGGTEYDEYYFEAIEETAKVLREELNSNTEEYPTYYYHSSW